MLRRFAATSALVLAAFTLSPAARAQGWFSFYEMSPRDVLSRLDEQGYAPRVPMTRRGDVYIVDASTSSGRSVRLIVSARDGRVLERYGATPRYNDYNRSRLHDDDGLYRRGDDEDYDRRPQAALGDPSHPRVLNFDGQNPDRLIPPATVPDASPDRARRHVAKKPVAPKDTTEPAEAAVAPSDVKPSDSRPVDSKPASPRIIEIPQAKAVVAPSKPDIKILPTPEPTSQARVETPRSETLKPATPRIVGEPLNQAKVEDKPATPKVVREAAPAQAKAEEKPKVEEKPKAEAPRKKLNDLPVGTLD
jgi:hypothetical protein